jgi:hypothetical protein
MDWDDFNVGFWHPFGTHGGEETASILNRKSKEISDTGWTLWSFQYLKPPTIQKWLDLIEAMKSGPIYTVCSDSAGAKDPQGQPNDCNEYLPVPSQDWLRIPSTIQVPHPFNKTNLATAFVVKRIIRPPEVYNQPSLKVEWFSITRGAWIKEIAPPHDKVPTRNVSLIKRGGQFPLRRVAAILELQPPYVVQVRAARP